MNKLNRSRDISLENIDEQVSFESEYKQKLTYTKTADVDEPPFSRLFLLIPKAMSEDELRQAFQIHGTIQDIYMVRDRRNQESKGFQNVINYISYRMNLL